MITFGETGLLTRDVCRLGDFYRALLELPPCGDTAHQTLLEGPVSLTITLDENAAPGRSACVAFTVDDLDAQYDRLLALGVPIEQPPAAQPWGARNLICLDPDGNRVYLRSFSAPEERGPARRMRASDRETYLAMAREFYQSDAVLQPVPESFLQAAFQELMRSDEYMEGYLLCEDGEPVGYAMLCKTFATEPGGSVIWLDELYVRPEHRGKGLGKAFFAYLHKHRPAARYRLEVEPDNEGAMRLYRSLGYRELPYLQMCKGK